MGLEHLGVVVGDTFDAFVGAHKPVLTGQQFQGPNSTPDPVLLSECYLDTPGWLQALRWPQTLGQSERPLLLAHPLKRQLVAGVLEDAITVANRRDDPFEMSRGSCDRMRDRVVPQLRKDLVDTSGVELMTESRDDLVVSMIALQIARAMTAPLANGPLPDRCSPRDIALQGRR